ncbi:unnamed protein product [Moneuplotes crassus]|uniref:Uncharacterized protein n=1 Tax=Euplotes crassus TaxID=5936 RepID=A0AAD1UGA7_EUPCR|nr:unnamed protein product [Moneuplotes crassus]
MSFDPLLTQYQPAWIIFGSLDFKAPKSHLSFSESQLRYSIPVQEQNEARVCKESCSSEFLLLRDFEFWGLMTGN